MKRACGAISFHFQKQIKFLKVSIDEENQVGIRAFSSPLSENEEGVKVWVSAPPPHPPQHYIQIPFFDWGYCTL